MSQQQEAITLEPQNEPESAPESSPPPPSPYQEQFPSFTNSFVIEDSFYRSRHSRPVHWSVAWSDLMMTMFILFLTMFVYQASQEEFLVNNSPEIVGGSTTEAIDILGDEDLIVPIMPLKNNAPLISSGTVKKMKKVQLNELDIDAVFRDNVVYVEPFTNKEIAPNMTKPPELDQTATPLATAPISQTPKPWKTPPPQTTDVIEPAPLNIPNELRPPKKDIESFQNIYDMSQQAVSQARLDNFASIELVPDKTMRIILTGDLLFYTGQADLSNKARKSLKKLTRVIKDLPYMINVIGHTDNLPMHSSRFASNWELSVVRASSVARFLISEMKMNPNQFVVSGYGSTRPRRPNTNTANRALNRRVEIIISKRLAPAIQATPENLL